MFDFLSLKPDIFGLDINDRSIKIVKLKKKRGFFKLDSLNDVDVKEGVIEEGAIKDEKGLAETIKKACSSVKGKKLNTKYAIASLPEEKAFLQVIQLPKMSEEELKSAVPLEAENYIPLPIDEVYLDFKSIDSGSGQLDILITAVPKATVDSYVSCIKEAGLIPVALEVESEAVARALIKGGISEVPLVILDVGKNTAGFIVFSGGSIRFTSSIKIVSKKSISESYMAELVSQVDKFIDFYQNHANHADSGKNKIRKIILAGGGSDSKGLAESLLKGLKIPAEPGNPWSNANIKQISPELLKFYKKPLPFCTAIGLAIRGAGLNDMIQ